MVNASRTARYSLARLSVDLRAAYALRGTLGAEFTSVYALAYATRADLRGSYALRAATPVGATLTGVHGMIGAVAEFVQAISAGVRGEELRVTGLDLRCDEDSYCISCTLEVATASEWLRCAPGETLDVRIGDTAFCFLLDARSRERTFGKTRYSVSGRSAAMLLDGPHAAPISRTWTGSTARAIARELCEANGLGLDWRMADWPLALYSAECMTPLEILSELMTDSGVLVSTPAGVLVAQYRYPVSPTRYASRTPDLELSDIEDVLTLKDSYESAPGYNTVAVLIDQDAAASGAELMVWDGEEDGVVPADPATQRIVALFPSRLDALQSPGCAVRIVDQGVRCFEKEEAVAVIDGEATLSYPPDSVLDYAYCCADLGTPAVSGKSVGTARCGHSVLHIRYRTSYRCYLVECQDKTQALVYVDGDALAREAGAPQLIHVSRAPADRPAPEIIEDGMCTNETSARERGRNYLDANGFDKEWYEATTPPRALPLPGAVVAVLDSTRGANFYAKLTGWTVNATLEDARLCSRVTYDLERSLAE